ITPLKLPQAFIPHPCRGHLEPSTSNHLEPPSLKNNTKAAKKATKTAALRNRGTNLSATFANSINA
ncbi:hypothetical protein ACRQQE_005074, partial [Serratia marcescens]